MFYGVFFVIMAIWSLLLAYDQGGAALLLIWPGVSFGLVGAAYLGVGARLFGKRDNGRLAWWAVMLLWPYLFLIWLVWYACRFTGEDCWNEIVPGVYLGRRAWAQELPANVGLIVDLTAEFAEPRAVVLGRSYLCLPTLDASVPEETTFRQLIERIAGWQGNVYIHCAMGHGRSGTTTMAVLLARGQADSVAEAESMVRRVRPGVRLKSVQRRLLERFVARANE